MTAFLVMIFPRDTPASKAGHPRSVPTGKARSSGGVGVVPTYAASAIAREAAEEQRMDEILEKLHREGRLGPDGRRKPVPGPRRAPLSQPDKKHVNEPYRQVLASTNGRPARTEAGLLPRGDRTGPLVLDAGMGTRLMARGLNPRLDDPALWNLSRPGDVLAIHCRDVAAGSGAILTNTFGANRFWLRKFGQAARSSRSIAAPWSWLAKPRARTGL